MADYANVKPEGVRNDQKDAEKLDEKDPMKYNNAKDHKMQAMNKMLHVAEPENSEVQYAVTTESISHNAYYAKIIQT